MLPDIEKLIVCFCKHTCGIQPWPLNDRWPQALLYSGRKPLSMFSDSLYLSKVILIQFYEHLLPLMSLCLKHTPVTVQHT